MAWRLTGDKPLPEPMPWSPAHNELMNFASDSISVENYWDNSITGHTIAKPVAFRPKQPVHGTHVLNVLAKHNPNNNPDAASLSIRYIKGRLCQFVM